MFDAKSILENIVRSAAPSQQPGGGSGSISDILNEIGKSLSQQQSATPAGAGAGAGAGTAAQPVGGAGKSISDILGELAGKLGQPSSSTGATAPGASPSLGDILAQLKEKLNRAGGSVSDGGSFSDILGKALSQATEGVKEGTARVGDATGATGALSRVAADPQAAEVIAKLNELMKNNPFMAGTAAGGLGGLVLGTSAGRSLASSAVRVGALAMIGGLAYKAVQNYQAGKPLITGASSPVPAPAGSGFEPPAVTNEAALHYIQAMIAAAAADGRVDPGEHDKLLGSLKAAGLGSEAEAFLAKELNNPASVQALAGSVTSAQEGIQLYTAARIAVAVDSPAEKQFLSSLAAALGIEPGLAAHIDATAQSAA